jgi:hypothetical protein
VKYLVRLIVVPSLATVAFLMLISGLRLEISPYDSTSATVLVLGIPFVYTMFSQLHRMDVLDRIEQLERQVEKLQLAASSSRDAR